MPRQIVDFGMPPRKKSRLFGPAGGTASAIVADGSSAVNMSTVGPLQRDVSLCVELMQLVIEIHLESLDFSAVGKLSECYFG